MYKTVMAFTRPLSRLKKKSNLLTFLILLWSHDIVAKEWSEREKQIFAAYGVLTATDMIQSRTAMKDSCECFVEANPLYGSNISDAEVIIGSALSMWAMHYLIENDGPDWIIGTMFAIRTAVIVNNHSVGVRIDVRI